MKAGEWTVMMKLTVDFRQMFGEGEWTVIMKLTVCFRQMFGEGACKNVGGNFLCRVINNSQFSSQDLSQRVSKRI